MQEKSLAYGLKVVNDCVYKKSQLVVEEQFFFYNTRVKIQQHVHGKV